jgi:Ca2+-transporting ATPase
LTSSEAARRLRERGSNEIRREAPTSRLTLWARQLASPVVWLPLGATAASAALRDFADAGAIGVIVLVNAFIGVLQERRAERAVEALRSVTTPRARVVRDGRHVIAPATTVVPGDLLVLEAGDVVAADARLVIAHALSANEATLTDESLPALKAARPVGADAPLGERHDTVFMGTSIATGSGTAAVVAFAARSQTRLLWEVGVSTNLSLLGVVVFSTLVQLAIHYVLALQLPFEAAARSPFDLALVVGMALVPVSLVELAKLPPRFRHAS